MSSHPTPDESVSRANESKRLCPACAREVDPTYGPLDEGEWTNAGDAMPDIEEAVEMRSETDDRGAHIYWRPSLVAMIRSQSTTAPSLPPSSRGPGNVEDVLSAKAISIVRKLVRWDEASSSEENVTNVDTDMEVMNELCEEARDLVESLDAAARVSPPAPQDGAMVSADTYNELWLAAEWLATNPSGTPVPDWVDKAVNNPARPKVDRGETGDDECECDGDTWCERCRTGYAAWCAARAAAPKAAEEARTTEKGKAQ